MPNAASVTRREALRLILGAPLAATACAGARRAKLPGGELLGANATLGHRIREHVRLDVPKGQQTRMPVVIVGGGVAGLSAAWCLRRSGMVPGRDFVILEMETKPGGTARAGGDAHAPYPWGAHYLPAPTGAHRALVTLLGEMDLITGADAFGDPLVGEVHLCHDPQERVFYGGGWHEGLYPHAGASTAETMELERFSHLVQSWVAWRDAQGRRAFTLPISLCSRAPECLALDTVSAEGWMQQQGFKSPLLKWLVDYACRDDYGGTLRQVSAWSLLFYFASRVSRPGGDARPLITWPEGNQRLVRALLQGCDAAMVPQTLATDIHVESDAGDGDGGDGGNIVVHALRDGAPAAWRAGRVIFAGPRYVARHVVRALHGDGSCSPGNFSAWVVANLALRARPRETGFPLAWDNVMYHSPSVGYVVNSHQQDRDRGPTTFTYYYPLCGHDPATARHMLLDLNHAHWSEAIMTDLAYAHPDLAALVTRMDIWRWGHAMIRPDIGTFANPARLAAALPYRGIHWAHSDLSGVALFEEAFDHGIRAAGEVLAARNMPAPMWS